jgi:hypothetical protein
VAPIVPQRVSMTLGRSAYKGPDGQVSRIAQTGLLGLLGVAVGQPDLVEFSGATNQAALGVGAEIPCHRDACLDRLLVDGTHGTRP